MKEFT